MRLLFTLDKKDYDDSMPRFNRPSVRGIIIRNGKVAMVHSLKYDYYKFPGGGIERGEDHRTTLCREVAEEAGLQVIPDSIREYGMVHRIQKGDHNDVFVQDNFYYLCDVEKDARSQNLDEYEAEENFVFEWIFPEQAIRINRISAGKEPAGYSTFALMLEREARVLELLMDENFFQG